MKKAIDINRLIDNLEAAYGKRDFQPHGDPLGELIQTVLSQNTSDKNSRPAYQALKQAFPDWNRLLEVPPEAIAAPIKSSGLAMIKARRIQQALSEIKNRRGELDLSFLQDLPVEKGLDWLRSLQGIGYKTASCILLFALGKPAMPVDTHVYRVTTRLGLLPQGTSLDEAHRRLLKMAPLQRIYPFHVLLIEHGRRTCSAPKPRCENCCLNYVCRYYKLYVNNPLKGNARKTGVQKANQPPAT
jgi:endonuclease-3